MCRPGLAVMSVDHQVGEVGEGEVDQSWKLEVGSGSELGACEH